MNTTTEQLFDAALALPDDDRVELVEALMATFRPADQAPFDDAWRTVIQRRSHELATGQVASVSWGEVKRMAREKADG